MADFIVNNYPDAKQWHDPVAKAAWYISHAFVAVVLGDEGEIVALVAARPVERPGLGVLPYYFNEGGRVMHVDLWVDISRGRPRAAGAETVLSIPLPPVQDDHDVPAL